MVLLFRFTTEFRATMQLMQLRLPWILSRRRLLAAVILDSVLRPSGWAQVNYPYGPSVEDAASKRSYDLYYLRIFSF